MIFLFIFITYLFSVDFLYYFHIRYWWSNIFLHRMSLKTCPGLECSLVQVSAQEGRRGVTGRRTEVQIPSGNDCSILSARFWERYWSDGLIRGQASCSWRGSKCFSGRFRGPQLVSQGGRLEAQGEPRGRCFLSSAGRALRDLRQGTDPNRRASALDEPNAPGGHPTGDRIIIFKMDFGAFSLLHRDSVKIEWRRTEDALETAPRGRPSLFPVPRPGELRLWQGSCAPPRLPASHRPTQWHVTVCLSMASWNCLVAAGAPRTTLHCSFLGAPELCPAWSALDSLGPGLCTAPHDLLECGSTQTSPPAWTRRSPAEPPTAFLLVGVEAAPSVNLESVHCCPQPPPRPLVGFYSVPDSQSGNPVAMS